jgi:hypothetical protein
MVVGHEELLDHAWCDGIDGGGDQVEIRDFVSRRRPPETGKAQPHADAARDGDALQPHMRNQPSEATGQPI